MSPGTPTKVECNECQYSRIIRPEDDELPGAVVIEHGEETGHKLSVTQFDGERDTLAP